MATDSMGENNLIEVGGLRVSPVFYVFVEEELLPANGIDSAAFWAGLEAIVEELTPINRNLLQHREELQAKIDAWHIARSDEPWNHDEYVLFLREIGYLHEPGEPFCIETVDVDPEIAEVAGPQLVVPVSNARFAINAANARWGSLYDALYGSDVIAADDGQDRGDAYNVKRGAAVIRYAAAFLDRTIPLDSASHSDVANYAVDESQAPTAIMATLEDGRVVQPKDAASFVGFCRDGNRCSYLFRHHGLHVELQTDPEHSVGRDASANVSDVVLEAAITTIQDCEDSVAAVDAGEKVGVYRNWLGLMAGTLEAVFEKRGKRVTRRLTEDRTFTDVDGKPLVLPGRSLMLIRNVGHLMTTDAVLDANGDEIFEGLLDAVVTTACAQANRDQTGSFVNSRSGSVYIVKPKMHGPDEVKFTDTLFSRVEALFNLAPNTLKVGVMDEERRTTINLQECIHAVKKRLVFINTGFLDRTGDEIHTSMHAGTVPPKDAIKLEPWIHAYEDWNVDTGIRCGLPGRAQIGKGMWPKPAEMKQMMDSKQAHPQAGANCAWVPSPTAATLHAMHYHAVDVRRRQQQLASRQIASLDDILTPPLCDPSTLAAQTVQDELDNNAQSILGYVVRWIDQGVGCSTVPDIDDVGHMEDRATLRISSQHIANWLLHGVTTEQQVRDTFRRMAEKVDEQNARDSGYRRMSDDSGNSIAFQAACALVFKAHEQPSGYTEPLLHSYRRQLKASLTT